MGVALLATVRLGAVRTVMIVVAVVVPMVPGANAAAWSTRRLSAVLLTAEPASCCSGAS